MDLIATTFDTSGTPVLPRQVTLNETRLEQMQVAYLRLGFEVTWISGTGKRVDYALVGAKQRLRQIGVRP